MGGALRAVGNFAKSVSNIASKVVDIGSKVMNVINKPMEALTSPLKKLAGGVLDKLPFGIGKFVKPFADKLIDGAASWVSGNVLGGVGIFAKAAKTVGDVTKIAETVKGVSDKVGALSTFPAQANFQNTIAWAHAQHIF